MTIRDELIRWLAENAAWDTADAEDLVDALDSVPPAMLAQLAIDTGGIERLGYISVKRREFAPDNDNGYRGPVYRIVGES